MPSYKTNYALLKTQGNGNEASADMEKTRAMEQQLTMKPQKLGTASAK